MTSWGIIRAEMPDGSVEFQVSGGFEHEGIWIEDSTKSPCGRFDLTPEQQRETYGDKS